MKIIVNRKKLLKALKRVGSLIKANDSLFLGKYEPLTVDVLNENVLQFTFTDGGLIVQFSFKAESIEGGNGSFGVNHLQLQAITSSLTDENVILSYDNPLLEVKGCEEGKATNFNLMSKEGYYIKDGKVDFSEKDGESYLSLNSDSFVMAISSMIDCPVRENLALSENVLCYKNGSGSTCMYATSGTVMVHYDYCEPYPLNSSLAIPRRTMAYVASLCEGGDIHIYKVNDSAYFEIPDNGIGDGFNINIKSKTTPGITIPNPELVISEKPIKVNVDSSLFEAALNRVNIFDSIGCDLLFSEDKLTISSVDSVGNRYTDMIDTTPISESPMAVIKLNHKILQSIIKHRNDVIYKIEVTDGEPLPQIVVTDESRNMVAVLAGFRS